MSAEQSKPDGYFGVGYAISGEHYVKDFGKRWIAYA